MEEFPIDEESAGGEYGPELLPFDISEQELRLQRLARMIEIAKVSAAVALKDYVI